MSIFLDTQVISYAYKGHINFNAENTYLSSTAALEFLEVYNPVLKRLNYYPVRITRLFSQKHLYDLFTEKEPGYGLSPLAGPYNCDWALINFGREYAPVKIYGNLAISTMINKKAFKLFSVLIRHIEKSKQRKLREKFTYILDNNITCDAIFEDDICLALELLERFTRKYSIKTNFLNSWNDLLVLSKAINKTARLYTQDNLLYSFASNHYSIKPQKVSGMLCFDFESLSKVKRSRLHESKGYINRGWDYKIRKGRGS